jgi:hypothetical protein
MQTTRRERLLAFGFVSMIVVGLLWQCGPPLATAQEPASITRGAAIRRADGVWGPIVNSAHANTLVASIVVEADGDIRVNFLPGGGRVIYGTAGDDESLAKLRIDCGPSMAPDHMIIRCWDQVTGAFVRGDAAVWNGATVNLWPMTVQESA